MIKKTLLAYLILNMSFAFGSNDAADPRSLAMQTLKATNPNCIIDPKQTFSVHLAPSFEKADLSCSDVFLNIFKDNDSDITPPVTSLLLTGTRAYTMYPNELTSTWKRFLENLRGNHTYFVDMYRVFLLTIEKKAQIRITFKNKYPCEFVCIGETKRGIPDYDYPAAHPELFTNFSNNPLISVFKYNANEKNINFCVLNNAIDPYFHLGSFHPQPESYFYSTSSTLKTLIDDKIITETDVNFINDFTKCLQTNPYYCDELSDKFVQPSRTYNTPLLNPVSVLFAMLFTLMGLSN